MTDRIHSITVVLKDDIRSDDAEELIKAFSLFRGVAGVNGNVTDTGQCVAEARVRLELTEKLWGILYPKRRTP